MVIPSIIGPIIFARLPIIAAMVADPQVASVVPFTEEASEVDLIGAISQISALAGSAAPRPAVDRRVVQPLRATIELPDGAELVGGRTTVELGQLGVLDQNLVMAEEAGI